MLYFMDKKNWDPNKEKLVVLGLLTPSCGGTVVLWFSHVFTHINLISPTTSEAGRSEHIYARGAWGIIEFVTCPGLQRDDRRGHFSGRDRGVCIESETAMVVET